MLKELGVAWKMLHKMMKSLNLKEVVQKENQEVERLQEGDLVVRKGERKKMVVMVPQTTYLVPIKNMAMKKMKKLARKEEDPRQQLLVTKSMKMSKNTVMKRWIDHKWINL